MIFNESVPNILQSQLKLELGRLQTEMTENNNEVTDMMNEIKDRHNIADKERLAAEEEIMDIHDYFHKLKYDDNIRHKYVY